MAYIDEIDVGDPVIVTDLRTGRNHPGTVESLDFDNNKVVVAYDEGGRYKVGPGFVTLLPEESWRENTPPVKS